MSTPVEYVEYYNKGRYSTGTVGEKMTPSQLGKVLV